MGCLQAILCRFSLNSILNCSVNYSKKIYTIWLVNNSLQPMLLHPHLESQYSMWTFKLNESAATSQEAAIRVVESSGQSLFSPSPSWNNAPLIEPRGPVPSNHSLTKVLLLALDNYFCLCQIFSFLLKQPSMEGRVRDLSRQPYNPGNLSKTLGHLF